MILVTGGTGYIGSHTAVELLRAGYDIAVVDNLCNSKPIVAELIKKLGGRDFEFIKADLCDKEAVDKLFSEHNFRCIIHFAALKAVAESVEKPLEYYQNNLVSTLNILDAMKKYGVNNLVFSSSATVYAESHQLPLREGYPLAPASPYGRTKLMIENILADVQQANPQMNIALLRYFNPIGADESGELGEDPSGIPNNLLPYISKVACGILPCLSVYGNDYPTPDGTCIRDYIHVTDVALGHIAALEKLSHNPGLVKYNLGTGKGSSVMEMIAAFSAASGKELPYRFAERREGDLYAFYADPSLAQKELGWKATRSIEKMCEDAWRFQRTHPNGYPD